MGAEQDEVLVIRSGKCFLREFTIRDSLSIRLVLDYPLFLIYMVCINYTYAACTPGLLHISDLVAQFFLYEIPNSDRGWPVAKRTSGVRVNSACLRVVFLVKQRAVVVYWPLGL